MKKRPVSALLLLILPTVAVVVVVLALMNWRAPTRIEVDLTVNRAVFTVGGDEATAILNASVRFQSVTIEKFSGIELSPEKLEVADPAQYIPTEDRYPEDAWTSLRIIPPVVITGENDTLQPAVTLESAEPESRASGNIDVVYVKPGAQVCLELRSDRIEDLTIQVEDQASFATLSISDAFQLISDYVRVSGITDFPYREEDSLSYRTQLPDDLPLIEIKSLSDSLALLLTVSSEEIGTLFYKGGIPVTSLEFVCQGPTGEIETTIIKGVKGHISYPDYPDIKKVSFQSPDFLGLDDLEKFRIEEITLNREEGGIQLRLSGVAGYIRTGSPDFPQDHRLTLFDTLWQSSKLTVVFICILWAFFTMSGVYQWARLRVREGEREIIPGFERKMKFIQHNFDAGAYTIVAKECVGLVEQILRRLFKEQLTRLDEKDRLKVQQAELKKGGGTKGVDHFTMGQLVHLLQSSHFLDAYERASGKDLSSLRVVNLDELTRLRNRLIHDGREATRAEAEFLIDCLRVFFETFELEPKETDSSE